MFCGVSLFVHDSPCFTTSVHPRARFFKSASLAPKFCTSASKNSLGSCLETSSCQCTAYDGRDWIELFATQVQIEASAGDSRAGLKKSVIKSVHSPIAWQSTSAGKPENVLVIFPRLSVGSHNWYTEHHELGAYLAGLWRETLPRGTASIPRYACHSIMKGLWPERPRSWHVPQVWFWPRSNCPVKFDICYETDLYLVSSSRRGANQPDLVATGELAVLRGA
ncbi:hypothetical protein GE09DRAFT_653406 [Coniochaeta sp. 2T2.1]|nr:hypothetical protein GE09DRAFT_653406 [Coniochaeta sp. 2T2.1]